MIDLWFQGEKKHLVNTREEKKKKTNVDDSILVVV